MAFEWQDEYSVGDAELDEQHKGIIRILNQLSQDIEGKENIDIKAASEKLFDQLAMYAMSHFAYEEQRMVDGGYPLDKVAEHRQAHNELIKKVQAMQAQIADGEATIQDLLPFLYGDWLIDHICNRDQDFRPYVTGAA